MSRDDGTNTGRGRLRPTDPPGEYEIAVTAANEPVATKTYEVLNGDLDEIFVGAQYQSGAALGQAIENTLSNI